MVPVRAFYVFLFVGFSVKADDGTVQIAGVNDKCAEFCTKTFQSQETALKSCQQGCRLYSVLQFVDKTGGNMASSSEPNATAITISCQNACNEGYKDAVALKSACDDGCQHQTPFTTGHLKIVMDDSSPMFSFANKLVSDSFGKFDDFQNRMLEHFEKVKNWFQNDPLKLDGSSQNNGLMNFFDRVDSRFRNLLTQLTNLDAAFDKPERKLVGGPEDVKSQSGGSTVNPLYAYGKSLARNSGKLLEETPTVGNIDENGEPIIIVKMIKNDGLFDGDDRRGGVDEDTNKIWFSFTQESLDKPHEPSPPLSTEDETFVDANDTWLACLARRTQSLSLLTRWLLCASLMLSILCMIYLCLAVMRANQQRRHRLYFQNKLGKKDAVFLMPPPPAYEKTGELLKQNEQVEQPESPPPAYDVAVQEAGEPAVKNV